MEVSVGGFEDAPTTVARDQAMLLHAVLDGVARARVWRRSAEALLLGRFHRADPAALPGEGVSRRLSGGRIVPVGPQVVCLTLALPRVDWLSPTAPGLRPEQVLNRGVRPLLALLRGDGVDAFYPGRDLVTVGGRPLAHLAFTVMRDGAALLEMHVAEGPAFARLPLLLDRHDPRGVAGVDRAALDAATCLAEQDVPARDDEAWALRFAAMATREMACEVAMVGEPVRGDAEATPEAALGLLASPGPVPEGSKVAVGLSMLGVVECAARLRGDRLLGLQLTGDLIAPFHTLDDIAAECEGEPFRPANVRKALTRAMSQPRSFVLGLRELDELILRME